MIAAGPLPPPMRIINEVDGDATPPWEFHYSNVMWHGKHVPKPNRKDRVGCGYILFSNLYVARTNARAAASAIVVATAIALA